ncbi:MAG: zinc ribbon domain-containing protein [Solirubrobacteraceae bacterium]|nr:zinc ribbon domain-containing protein [Solirubrobacteraceae bacterium]
MHGKVAAIDAVDRELRAIEDALGRRAPYDELFIPGVSACPRCGALHGSDARFCPNCGLAFSGPRSVASVAAPATAPAPAAAPAPEPFPPAPPA